MALMRLPASPLLFIRPYQHTLVWIIFLERHARCVLFLKYQSKLDVTVK